jgi:hypothetical protein
MTKEERIKRYEVIVKWGADYLDTVSSYITEEYRHTLDFEFRLLHEYINGLAELKSQEDV